MEADPAVVDPAAAAQEYIQTLRHALTELDIPALTGVLGVLEKAYIDRRTIFVCGNGGSAATASHMVVDIAKNTRCPGAPPVRAISLVDHVSALTAYANDEGYENVFSGQLVGLVEPGDVVVGISTSGNSPNVLKALAFAREAGATTIGLLGSPGGTARELCDAFVTVTGGSIEREEDVHMMLVHIITRHLRALVRGNTWSALTTASARTQ
ncbi:SIS domain-containing protein [Streptomyces avermitilis]|uniref:D-sedoheptulose-7-phosphate isomerase n=1 Tax=Streptomyces avermitilis TaxID=33903 RepID=UPI003827F18D